MLCFHVGFIFASMAVGTSHIIQCIRAGSSYGFAMIPFILITCLLKYPFFEIPLRYSIYKCENVLTAYGRIHFLVPCITAIILMLMSPIVCFLLTMIASGFLNSLFPNIPLHIFFILIMTMLLMIYLNSRGIGWLALFSTLSCLTVSISTFILIIRGSTSPSLELSALPFTCDYRHHLAFLLPLMGWMPTAMDTSVFTSAWELCANKKNSLSLSHLRGFLLSYTFCSILAVLFVIASALFLYGKDIPFSSAGSFCHMVISLYSGGNISLYILFSLCFFLVLFGSLWSAVDGYSLSLKKLFSPLFSSHNGLLTFFVLYQLIVSCFLFALFDHFIPFVDFATTLSFTLSPFIALFNLLVLYQLPPQQRGSTPFRILCYLGLIFLTSFSFIFLFF